MLNSEKNYIMLTSILKMLSNISPYETWFESLRSLYLDIIRYIDRKYNIKPSYSFETWFAFLQFKLHGNTTIVSRRKE